MKNIQACEELTRAAHNSGADLICLPEFFAYLDNDNRKTLDNSFTEDQHPALILFSELAKELNVWILLGSLAIKISETKLNNRSYLIDADGKIAAHYNKIHLFDVHLSKDESYLESEFIVAGDQAVLAPTPWGSIGMSICYDLRFPYLYRHLVKKGASFLSVPAAFSKTTGEAHWHILNRARAIETGSYVFAPCQCGEHPGDRFTYGHSLIIDPWGTVIADGGDQPGFIVAEVNPQQVRLARERIPALQHDQEI